MLRRLYNSPSTIHNDLLVGIETSDDAGVYRISDEMALVQSVDFLTPIVDNARDWGRIAAANALSDIYAMGGTPLTALQTVSWPRGKLSWDLLGDVLVGGSEVLTLANCTLLGGHSVDDPEPKYGMAITGIVHPDDLVTNTGAAPGDVIVLTKPLGTGIAVTAIKHENASDELVLTVTDLMTTLNVGAATAMRRVGVKTGTDITGYGLLGHLVELLRASNVSATLHWDDIPWVAGIETLAEQGMISAGTRRNLGTVQRSTDFHQIDEVGRLMLADAQTSGGLLAAVDAPLEKAFLQALEDEGATGWVIGRFREREFADGPGGRIDVTGER